MNTNNKHSGGNLAILNIYLLIQYKAIEAKI